MLGTRSNGSSTGSNNVVVWRRVTTSLQQTTLPSSNSHLSGYGWLRVMSPHPSPATTQLVDLQHVANFPMIRLTRIKGLVGRIRLKSDLMSQPNKLRHMAKNTLTRRGMLWHRDRAGSGNAAEAEDLSDPFGFFDLAIAAPSMPAAGVTPAVRMGASGSSEPPSPGGRAISRRM